MDKKTRCLVEIDKDGFPITTHVVYTGDKVAKNSVLPWSTQKIWYKPRWDFEKEDWIETGEPPQDIPDNRPNGIEEEIDFLERKIKALEKEHDLKDELIQEMAMIVYG